MKVLLSAVVITVSFALSAQSQAADPTSDASAHPTVSHNDSQDNSAHNSHTEGHGSEKLFPQPKPDPENARFPGTVELLEPAYFSSVSGQTTLKWKDVADAANYHLQVATDPNFKWLVADEHMYKATSYEIKNLEAGKHYYWRVAASNQAKWAGSTKGYFSKSMFETK